MPPIQCCRCEHRTVVHITQTRCPCRWFPRIGCVDCQCRKPADHHHRQRTHPRTWDAWTRLMTDKSFEWRKHPVQELRVRMCQSTNQCHLQTTMPDRQGPRQCSCPVITTAVRLGHRSRCSRCTVAHQIEDRAVVHRCQVHQQPNNCPHTRLRVLQRALIRRTLCGTAT